MLGLGRPHDGPSGSDDGESEGNDNGSGFHFFVPNKAQVMAASNGVPVRFSLNRCAKCKHQSKGTYYCRVSNLHLYAPDWEEVNPMRPWVPPTGFLQWLRTDGPVKGCRVRRQ